MLSKSFIQFSVAGWGCVPSLLFDLRPNYGGGNEDNGDNGDLLQKLHACTATLSAPGPAAGLCMPAADPRLCWRLLDTYWQVWVSLGQSVLGLLSPGVHKVLFVPSKSLFPQSCVSSVGSMVGLMATSSKRAYAISSSAVPKAPAPVAADC